MLLQLIPAPLTRDRETSVVEFLISRFRVTDVLAQDVAAKMKTMYDNHLEFHVHVEKAKSWMEESWETIRSNSYTSGKSKEELQAQLRAVQRQIDVQEAGLGMVQAAAESADRAMRNTRSDGKDAILQTLKELNTDWEKLTKKMATAKVGVESDLLQW